MLNWSLITDAESWMGVGWAVYIQLNEGFKVNSNEGKKGATLKYFTLSKQLHLFYFTGDLPREESFWTDWSL